MHRRHPFGLEIIAICLVGVGVFGCASAPQREPDTTARDADEALELFAEAEALAMIDHMLLEARFEPVPGWRVRLEERADIEVDVRLGNSSFGIEWVSDSDRAHYGSALPSPDPSGPLRLLGGEDTHAGAREKALILVLDPANYGFKATDKRRFDRDGQHEAKKRLQRDLLDFLDYVKGQYPL